MDNDVDLMRDLLLILEARQVSPRANVVIDIEEEALELGRAPEMVETHLNVLGELEYIAGAGLYEPGFFLFRKLTRKGNQFVKATRTPEDWARMKSHYANQRFPTRA